MVSLASLALVFGMVFSATTATASDVDTIMQRRRVDLADFPPTGSFKKMPTWLANIQSDGTWSDVNYLSGCTAQRANWPIQQHWVRVITLAAAWSGLNPLLTTYTGNDAVLAAALKGMDYWFANDYTNMDCIGQGGTDACPCGTPGLWNSNWYDQVILIPQLVSTACLLLDGASLSANQTAGCYDIPYRAYALRDTDTTGVGSLTGANMVLLMELSVSLALYSNDTTMLADAMTRAMSANLFADTKGEDGIHRDGSFLQHTGILYNGNYGKDSLNGFISLEKEAIGTAYAASSDVRSAIATMVRGSEWMINRDSTTGNMYWDFNTIGRFITFATTDYQASSDINFNTTDLAAATVDFSGDDSIIDTLTRLESNGTIKLTGNKGFWASDYMSHRRSSFTLANKMISSRGKNTEYTNSANPYGYHLGQGTLFSYVAGNEYKDIEAMWDWNLIPGTTVLLDHPGLTSSIVGYKGKKTFVGVVSDGTYGISAMDYTDPYDASISYRKAWFYLDSSVLVTTTSLSVSSSANGSPITVLDQRLAASDSTILVDGSAVTASSSLGRRDSSASGYTLYYGGNGYLSHDVPFNLTLAQGAETGNWSVISTSTAGMQTKNLFSAYTTIPATTYSYQMFPATSSAALQAEAANATTTRIDVSGTVGTAGNGLLALAFFPSSATNVTTPMKNIGWRKKGIFSVSVSKPALVLIQSTRRTTCGTARAMTVTVSDPTQLLTTVTVKLVADAIHVECPADSSSYCTNTTYGVTLTVSLPTGGEVGSSVQLAVVAM